jgi:ankyrin repeat protein
MQTLTFLPRRLLTALLWLILCTGWGLSSPANAANTKDYWVYVANDNVAAVKELLVSGFDPNTRSPNQQTGLIQATRDGAWQVFDVLLEAPKVNVNAANQYNETPLMYVALIGDLARLKRLIAIGAKVNKEGWTPLHYAAVKARAEVTKVLLQSGALPNELSPEGDTALILAVRADSVDTVQALINGGADPSLSNLKAQDAIDVARSRGKEDLAKALEKVVENRKLKKQ